MSVLDIFFQFFGFLLQILPMGILYPVPFKDDELLLPRRKLAVLLCSGIVLIAAGFAPVAWMVFDPLGRHDAFMRISFGLYMAVCVVLCAVTFFLTVRAPVMKKVIVLVLLIHYTAVLSVLSSILTGGSVDRMSGSAGALGVYGKDDLAVSGMLLVFTLPLICLFLKYGIRSGFACIEDRTLTRSCVYLLLALLLFFVGAFSVDLLGAGGGLLGKAALLVMSAFILTDCILYFMFFVEVRLTVQIHQQKEQLRSFDDQYGRISSSIEEARRARHDIRHHLNLISAMDHRGERRELKAYLGSYEASFQEMENMSLCGYPAFGSIIQYYIESADKQGIRVRTELSALRESLRFDVVDLTVLLGNLMENAIEACCQLPPDAMRSIQVWVRQSGVSFLLEVENSCSDTGSAEPDFTDCIRFISTKHASGRGQGLKSIRSVAEKYGGSAEFRKKDRVFTARIVLNIP